jgi:maleylpyruvate isomerase
MTDGWEPGDVAGVRHATTLLVTRLESGFDPRAPSQLPGWTVAQVVTHIARNADSVTRMLDGARAGRVDEQYPGGIEAREAAIDAGAVRATAELVDDVRTSGARLVAVAEAITPELWAAGRGRVVTGIELPLWRLIASRWREVEIHHGDCGLGYSWADWSDAFVDRALPLRLAEVNERQPPGERFWVAWPGGPRSGSEPIELVGDRRLVLAYLFARAELAGFPPLSF